MRRNAWASRLPQNSCHSGLAAEALIPTSDTLL
jgi:hypothetical protein